ncbi:MAG: Lacal_2735 family protein [Oceanospirillales bacterium]|nr:MAG: Lacal_2735 family protein [Oceanospirillales bacterium]
MFGLFKSSAEKQAQKLQQAYEKKLTEAMNAQRNGDIRGYSALSEEADKLLKELQALNQ